ncbi:unnamed protein product [Vicia faba]|uniref:Uncharacterized protein n=1 Tax=Vicia faba TaxID=3906 RepID=A0AAV1BBG7_VICFA|nr:unnamed protein product [Vicia faba]
MSNQSTIFPSLIFNLNLPNLQKHKDNILPYLHLSSSPTLTHLPHTFFFNRLKIGYISPYSLPSLIFHIHVFLQLILEINFETITIFNSIKEVKHSKNSILMVLKP